MSLGSSSVLNLSYQTVCPHGWVWWNWRFVKNVDPQSNPLWPKRFSNTLARGCQNVTLKATLRASQKEHGEKKSFTWVQEEQAACTSVCCVVFRASDWGLSDRCENAVRDAFTLTDTCWEQCMLADVKWGWEKNRKNARLKIYLGKYWHAKQGLQSDLMQLKPQEFIFSVFSQLTAINCSKEWMMWLFAVIHIYTCTLQEIQFTV